MVLPLIPLAITGANIFSSMYGAHQSAKSQEQANRLNLDMAREQMAFEAQQASLAMDFSAKEAAKSRDWQEYMSNTAHSREVKDLISAGLNPILSANGGASTPGGAMGSSSMAGSSGARFEPTKPKRAELYLATARAVQDIILAKEMVKTERTKQELNRAEANAKSGTFKFGPFTIPIANWANSARGLWNRGVNRLDRLKNNKR